MVDRIGFFGAGQMATALARGLTTAGVASPESIWAADPFAAARDHFAAEVPGSQVGASNAEVAATCDLLVLAVKPRYACEVLREVATDIEGKLVVSLAAGVRSADLAAAAPAARVVRVMPNTPALVGEGASAYALGPGATAEDAQATEQLLAAVGVVACVDESLLDAVTAVSGSGPAYAFVIIEALADGGVQQGLPRDVALRLAAQTLRGAATLVLAGEHPAVLKDRVASPGGTTIAGLAELEQHGVRAGCIGAVAAAARRSRELSRESGPSVR